MSWRLCHTSRCPRLRFQYAACDLEMFLTWSSCSLRLGVKFRLTSAHISNEEASLRLLLPEVAHDYNSFCSKKINKWINEIMPPKQRPGRAYHYAHPKREASPCSFHDSHASPVFHLQQNGIPRVTQRIKVFLCQDSNHNQTLCVSRKLSGLSLAHEAQLNRVAG